MIDYSRRIATKALVEDVARYTRDMAPSGVSETSGILLGIGNKPSGVQPVDLALIIEVNVDVLSQAATVARLGEAFRVLGSREVPQGTAFACAVPPKYIDALGHQTFTIMVRPSSIAHRFLYAHPPKEAVS